MNKLDLSGKTFDFAYSSLAFHYVKNLEKLINTLSKALVPKSHLVFSMEHPIYTAPSNPKWTKVNDNTIWPLNHYQIEGGRTTNWLDGEIHKQHRTLGTIINTLVESGFIIKHVEDWKPSIKQLEEHPEWSGELDRPWFLIVSAQRD